MSHPIDAFDAPVPVYVLTGAGEIVPLKSREGLSALVDHAALRSPSHASAQPELHYPDALAQCEVRN